MTEVSLNQLAAGVLLPSGMVLWLFAYRSVWRPKALYWIGYGLAIVSLILRWERVPSAYVWLSDWQWFFWVSVIPIASLGVLFWLSADLAYRKKWDPDYRDPFPGLWKEQWRKVCDLVASTRRNDPKL